MKLRAKITKNSIQAYHQIISKQQSLNNILVASICLVFTAFSAFAIFTSLQIYNIKNEIVDYVKEKTSELVEQESMTRIERNLHSYLETEKFLSDNDVSVLNLIKEGRSLSNDNIRYIIDYLERKKIFISRLNELSDKDGRVTAGIVMVLSKCCRSEKIDNFFRSLLSPTITIQSSGMPNLNPYLNMFNYFYVDVMLYEAELIQLLELERDNKYIGFANANSLVSSDMTPKMAEVLIEILVKKPYLIQNYQNNKAVVDKIISSNLFDSIEIVKPPVKPSDLVRLKYDKENISLSEKSIFIQKWCEVRKCAWLKHN